jgi:hypothetical protein
MVIGSFPKSPACHESLRQIGVPVFGGIVEENHPGWCCCWRCWLARPLVRSREKTSRTPGFTYFTTERPFLHSLVGERSHA